MKLEVAYRIVRTCEWVNEVEVNEPQPCEEPATHVVRQDDGVIFVCDKHAEVFGEEN